MLIMKLLMTIFRGCTREQRPSCKLANYCLDNHGWNRFCKSTSMCEWHQLQLRNIFENSHENSHLLASRYQTLGGFTTSAAKQLSSFSHHCQTRSFSVTSCYLNGGKNDKSKWENLLDSDDKRNNIESIPVKRENIYTIPNLLSCMRIGLTPYLGYLVIHSDYTLALALSALAAFTDFVDGYIARTWPSQQSAVGSALDPLADKILVAVLAVSLTYVNIIPVALTTVFIGRDVLLIGSVFYLRYKTCPPPVTLKRYFDPSLVNTKLAPTFLSKVNTALQIIVIWSSLASPVFGFVDHILLKSLWGVTMATTVASGIGYITRKDTVRILKEDDFKDKTRKKR